MPTDAEKAYELVRDSCWSTDLCSSPPCACQDRIAAALAAVRAEATAAAEQRIADLTRERDETCRSLERAVYQIDQHEEREHTDAARIAALEAEVERLKERNADQYKALKKKWKDDWRAHNPDEAKAHDIIKRAAALLQSDRERAEAAEKERDEARVAWAKRNVECLLAKSRLARARADALEEAARLFDDRSVPIARQIRALADSETWPDYEAAARFLFDLLDDIDTAEDRAKADDATFRKLAHRLHRRRFEVAETDGYKVTFKPAGRAALAAETLEE